ncbi:hypothetical protein HHI36_001184 [Cryptolaemus montrouzieri]
MDTLSRIQIGDVGLKAQTLDEVDSTSIQVWNNKKALILNKYTTVNKISIVSSYLPEDDKIVFKSHNPMVDKVQNRLEQLDWCEESSQRRVELSQTEYISKIDMLNKELVSAWNSEQRVKAVKIAIQCAKLLADTDVMCFYPSKFVLITEILDIFGHFVYDRLKHIAETRLGSHHLTTLPENFTPDMISDLAKETCLNWFHKIASIRELVPRLYVELAIIRSYRFLSTTKGSEALFRITKMINGIGNPLVSTYARCYLCRVGLPSLGINKSYVLENFKCIIEHHQLFTQEVTTAIKTENISVLKYLDLFSPALDFIMEIVTSKATNSRLDDIFLQCIEKGKSSLLLNTIITVFKPNYVASRTVEFLEMVGQCAENGYPVSNLLCSLGNSLGKYPPPPQQRKSVLHNIGKYSNSFQDFEEYLCYVEAWMPFIAKNFKVREVDTMLGDIISRVSCRKDCGNVMNQFRSIMTTIFRDVEETESLLTLENFLPFLDLFHQDSVKVEVCKMILTCCKNNIQISDPIMTNTLAFLCTILHDSVDALTPEDELRQIGLLICNVIRKVNYGRDFEQQLNFYVEARSSFSNVDSVLIELVQKTNTLMVKTRDIMQGVHNKKTADFVRACAAYCFITIPSISSSKARLELYLLSGQVALYNQCLVQADSSFRAAISNIIEYQEDYTKKDEYFLVAYIKKFICVLLVTPDNPDLGVLSLLRSLLQVLQQYKWDHNGTSLVTIYLAVLDVLSVMAQDMLPYHIDKVDSNDALYGGDEKFITEVNKICSLLVIEILSQLKMMGSSRKQSLVALELFIRLMNRCDLREPTMHKLMINLWQQCSRRGFIDQNFMDNLKLYYACKSNNDFMEKVVENLK